MTYVSRRTRIIVSSWLDECDAEYRLRATRKRSDGRLKKYSSCDDFRAWVNDNCIKHEYLADLMSNGEFPGRSPFRLFGRFIPVPVLFQLAQGSSRTFASSQTTNKEAGEGENENVQEQEVNQQEVHRDMNQESNRGVDQDVNARRSKSATNRTQSDEEDEADLCVEDEDEMTFSGDREQDASKVASNSDLIRTQWEKSLLEKSLLQCTCLLNKAMKKLENIDGIVAQVDEEFENARTEEIQESFLKSKLSCSCSAVSSAYNLSPSSKPCSKKLKDSAKCTELLRKISGLREKLKRVQECRREVNQQIQYSRRRCECVSSVQVTELYSRREQTNIKKLQKKLEKLIAERGRLLSEMCQALTSLNNIKRSSKSSINFRKADSKSFGTGNDFPCERLGESAACNCGCKCSEHSPESEDSARYPCSESSFSDTDDNSGFVKSRQRDKSLSLDFHRDESANYDNEDADFDANRSKFSERGKPTKRNNNFDPSKRKQNQQLASLRETNTEKENGEETQKENSSIQGTKGEDGKTEDSKEKGQERKCSKKSKVQFVCPESPCRKKLDADDLSAFDNTLTQEQLCIVSEALQNIQVSRPSTAPTTKRERQSVSASLDKDKLSTRKRSPELSPLNRRVKSETTMKDIEKTLRNYQRRLSDMENLESKVEEMKGKISESHTLRKNLAQMKAAKKQREADSEKSEREISRLCSENWELKRQVQDLTARYSAQSKKFQNLKCGTRELECQAEELKKELSEYREGFEHQRKCISKWESVVAVQRTEIENLMNHIRMLTTYQGEEKCSGYQDRRYVQRSRSYSPELIKARKSPGRQRAQARAFTPASDDEGECYCEAHKKPDNRPMSPQREAAFDRGYYPRETQWCN